MKKIYILAVLVTFVSFGFAQKHVGKPISTKSISINSESRSTTDTLYAVPWQTVNACDSFFIYGVSGGGYVTGTNNYGDLEKAQKFSLTGLTNPIQVTNILAPFWTNTPTSTANIVMKIYSVNTTTKGPQTLLGTSNAVTISQIVTGGMTNFTFTTPVTVTTSFSQVLSFLQQILLLFMNLNKAVGQMIHLHLNYGARHQVLGIQCMLHGGLLVFKWILQFFLL
jgi:hypothetical protein